MPKHTSIREWLNDLETRNVQEIQLGLTRIKIVAERLDLLNPVCPIITVAGTNGKGSTVTALETIYHTAGYKVGAYTSPHLFQFNERIRVGLTPISDEDLCQAFELVEEARQDIALTYFEMATLAALGYFKTMKLDVLILEVGLGGRLDATNIIDADVSVISTVDFDHQEYLGTTLEAIAYEKSGIVRERKPLIYADYNPPNSILEVALKNAAPTYLLGQDFSYLEQNDSWSVHYKNDLRTRRITQIDDLPKPSIQLKSAAAAITVCLLLHDDLPVAHSEVQAAMRRIFIPGRLQMVQGTVPVLYDVSHNPQSARLLAKALHQMNYSRVHAVFSALQDKDILGLIDAVKKQVDFWYPALLDNKRAASVDLLLSSFKDAEVSVEICYNSPLVAFDEAVKQAEPGDLIVVYGSFFIVGQVAAANRRFNETSN